jgi:hypothetical protein
MLCGCLGSTWVSIRVTWTDKNTYPARPKLISTWNLHMYYCNTSWFHIDTLGHVMYVLNTMTRWVLNLKLFFSPTGIWYLHKHGNHNRVLCAFIEIKIHTYMWLCLNSVSNRQSHLKELSGIIVRSLSMRTIFGMIFNKLQVLKAILLLLGTTNLMICRALNALILIDVRLVRFVG